MVVIMSILTTLVVPPVLRALYVGDPETEISPEDTESQAGLLPEALSTGVSVRRQAAAPQRASGGTTCSGESKHSLRSVVQ